MQQGFHDCQGYEEHKVQDGEKILKCFECDEKFGTKRALAQHMRELCSEETKEKGDYNCEYCPAGPFRFQRYLRTHLKKCSDNPNRPAPMWGKKVVLHW